MDESLEHRALAICTQALKLLASEREKFLDEECKDQIHLRALVNELLGRITISAQSLQTGGAIAHHTQDLTGEQIGGYSIRDLLGRGGMGAVYRAVRTHDGVEAQFALKTLARPLANDGSSEQFRVEQTTLARLNHPFIASFVDMGTSEEGIPYYVMEYIHL